MIVLAATTALTAAAAAQDRGGEFGRGDFGGGPAMGRGMGGGMGGGMGMMGRFSPEDIEAFTDARIAALHAGLRLSPDQQQMWPPVEQAIRDLVKLRREQFRAWRERREQGGDPRDDLPGMLRGMAERQAVRAEALRKLAEAAAPLYASFDDGQKRRLRMLVRHMRPGGGIDRKSTRLNSIHANISYAVFCLKKKKKDEYIECDKLDTHEINIQRGTIKVCAVKAP